MKSGIFAILDDILILMDDALMLTKTATKKTAGILADDLAINADKASGFKPIRELPVLWKISKGSFINKLIILPAVFLLSTYLPFLIIPILLCGGVYLSFEGALNVKMLFNKKERVVPPNCKKKKLKMPKNLNKKGLNQPFSLISYFLLKLSLLHWEHQPFVTQIIVVSLIALLATVGVYGFVAFLVRMDDLGYHLMSMSKNNFNKSWACF